MTDGTDSRTSGIRRFHGPDAAETSPGQSGKTPDATTIPRGDPPGEMPGKTPRTSTQTRAGGVMSLPLTANHPTSARSMDGVLDWARMLSGAGLIVFMWAHLILVASVNLGPRTMDAVAGFFETAGLVRVGGPVMFALFLTHFLLAMRQIPLRPESQRIFWAHAWALRHVDTWLWAAQVISGLVILCMGAFHMWMALADQPITALKSAARVRSGGWLYFYMALLPLAELHAGVGAYRIAVKWGLAGGLERRGLGRAGTLLTLLFVLIGALTLARFRFLRG